MIRKRYAFVALALPVAFASPAYAANVGWTSLEPLRITKDQITDPLLLSLYGDAVKKEAGNVTAAILWNRFTDGDRTITISLFGGGNYNVTKCDEPPPTGANGHDWTTCPATITITRPNVPPVSIKTKLCFNYVYKMEVPQRLDTVTRYQFDPEKQQLRIQTLLGDLSYDENDPRTRSPNQKLIGECSRTVKLPGATPTGSDRTSLPSEASPPQSSGASKTARTYECPQSLEGHRKLNMAVYVGVKRARERNGIDREHSVFSWNDEQANSGSVHIECGYMDTSKIIRIPVDSSLRRCVTSEVGVGAAVRWIYNCH